MSVHCTTARVRFVVFAAAAAGANFTLTDIDTYRPLRDVTIDDVIGAIGVGGNRSLPEDCSLASRVKNIAGEMGRFRRSINDARDKRLEAN